MIVRTKIVGRHGDYEQRVCIPESDPGATYAADRGRGRAWDCRTVPDRRHRLATIPQCRFAFDRVGRIDDPGATMTVQDPNRSQDELKEHQ